MPKLDARLTAVADQISGGVHADIGSDHGYLLYELLTSGTIERGIAIENKQGPLNNSATTLAGLEAEVRFESGFSGLKKDEADSVSLCGMGGELIAGLLGEFPARVPNVVIAQPNRCPEAVRRWALSAGYHLIDERMTSGRKSYLVLRFRRSAVTPDPAYCGVDREAAELFGPLLIKRWENAFVERRREEYEYLQRLKKRTADSQRRLDALTRILGL